MKDIKALTGLRGYAALMVCLHHYNYRLTGSWFYDVVGKGDWGVIIFFVLSGFILAYVYQGWFRQGWNGAEFVRFMRLRLARVYPLHLLTLLLWSLLILLGRIQLTEADTPYTFLLNLTLTHAWGFTPSISWNQPSWSISSEFFCYLLFSSVIMATRNVPLYLRLLLMLALLVEPLYHPYAMGVKAVMDRLHLKFAVHQFEYGISLVDWFCTFVFGMLSYSLVAQRSGGRWFADILVLTGLCLLGWGVAINLTDNGHIRVMVTLAAALMIVGIYLESRIGDVLIGNRFAVFLGDISYALYLSHILLRQVLNKAWPMWGQVLAAITVAALLHYVFERPCRDWLRKRARQRLAA